MTDTHITKEEEQNAFKKNPKRKNLPQKEKKPKKIIIIISITFFLPVSFYFSKFSSNFSLKFSPNFFLKPNPQSKKTELQSKNTENHEKKHGVVADRVTLLIDEIKTKVTKIEEQNYKVVDSYDVEIQTLYKRKKEGPIRFFVGLASLWGKVEIFDINNSIRTIVKARSKEFREIEFPGGKIDSVYNHKIKGRISDLHQGLLDSNFDLGIKEDHTQDFWSKNLNTYDKVKKLEFKIQRSAIDKIIHLQRLSPKKEIYQYENNEFQVKEDEQHLTVSLDNPPVDHTYRLMVKINQ